MTKQYLTYNDVQNYALAIGREILLSDWRPDYIVGITRGGLLPATLLSQFLKIPMVSLDVSLRDNTMEMGPTSNAWMSQDAFESKNILVVDDINDTGATLEWIMDDWKSGCMPHHVKWKTIFGDNVRFAVIVDNESSEYNGVSYSGLEINKAENDVWIDFPWEDWWESK